MTWLGVQANLRLPDPPPASTSNWSHSSVSPLSYHSTTGRGEISPVSGSIDMTSTGIRWLTILPIFSVLPSASTTRAS
jgi:hypothetical protein